MNNTTQYSYGAITRGLDRAYSIIRRDKLRARHILMLPQKDTDKYYQVLKGLRQQVSEFTTTLIQILKEVGYNAYTFSSSRWLMLDTAVHVDINGSSNVYQYLVISYHYSHGGAYVT